MELSLPDMPFGVGGRRARADAHPGESAVSADGESWLLINASPDLPSRFGNRGPCIRAMARAEARSKRCCSPARRSIKSRVC